MKNNKNKTGSRGFTIAELLIVVLIIVLAVGIGGGIYVGPYKKMLVEKSAKDFLIAAKYARVLAIERQQRCRIQFDKNNKQFGLVADRFDEKTGENKAIEVRDEVIKKMKLAGDVEFENIKIVPLASQEDYSPEQMSSITFLPDGTSQKAVVQIGDGKDHYTVSISAATAKAKVTEGTVRDVKDEIVDLDEI
jgi:Tfp pilus assembly protein FimT